jgi:hypothetical protein
MLEIEVVPEVSADERRAFEHVLDGVRDEMSREPRRQSAWWRAGALEALESLNASDEDPYALSPRSTRGATRA